MAAAPDATSGEVEIREHFGIKAPECSVITLTQATTAQLTNYTPFPLAIHAPSPSKPTSPQMQSEGLGNSADTTQCRHAVAKRASSRADSPRPAVPTLQKSANIRLAGSRSEGAPRLGPQAFSRRPSLRTNRSGRPNRLTPLRRTRFPGPCCPINRSASVRLGPLSDCGRVL